MPIDRTTTETPRSAEFDHTEARMRQALGLREGSSGEHPPQQRPEQARPKHRFARDGEIPVVVLHTRREPDSLSSPRNRLAALEATLQTERAARSAAERSLAEALANVQSLRTKLAHSELAQREVMAAAQAIREQAEKTLREAELARSLAEKAVAEKAIADRVVADRLIVGRANAESETADKAAGEPLKKRITRPRKTVAATRVREPKPVRWWVPSFRAKTG